MCGIVAMFSRSSPVSPVLLENATRRLYHRGPDGQRRWISPDGRVALGHARLSIIDLTTGDQPISSEDGRKHIIVNGEFYDYEAIQRNLEGSGHYLRTRSDSEIALHLYEDLGIQCLHRLRGEFALVLWDENHRSLFAARDRFGIKPLFYAMHGETLYLASEVKALFAAGVPARWDAEAVAQATEFGSHQVRTLFDGIFQVPPGHYLIATDRHVELNQYWDFNYPRKDSASLYRSDKEYTAEFRHVLEDAVRLRLRADVPVGCYLSGGLDSCSVLGLAARHRSDPIRAFTLTFDRADYDEEKEAKEMAAKVHAEFFPIPIRQDDLADNFADAIHQSETFCFNAHGVAKYLLSRAVRDAGYKVVITGEGSDEILGGYAHFRRDMVLYNRDGQDSRESVALLEELERLNPVSRGLLLPHGTAKPLENVKRILGFVPSWIETFSARAAKMQPLWHADFLATYGSRESYHSLLSGIDVRGRLSGRDAVHQSLYLWSKTLLPGYILNMLGDRMEMAHSVEGRVPFLDHEVVEVLCSQPVHQKIHGMTEKYVLREAVRDVITETVYKRQKHPFLSPPATLNPKGKLSALVNDTLRGPVLGSIPFFDQKKVVALLDSLHTMDEGAQVANDQVLMILVSACVLQERFGLDSGAHPECRSAALAS
ncbi:MAG: asparagine synthase (glutamine-hydrolyzing) [Acidobacteria bacterium]|nr:asparagine synthase (glutamine-hydrolyzing) [Acidobacteriota bacterium]MBV9623650.1 asparagine synthase (glutamine-hydrolyzing) [Acidobacteriota bacterium]